MDIQVLLLIAAVVLTVLALKKLTSRNRKPARTFPPDEILGKLENESTDQDLLNAGKGDTGINLNDF